MIDGRVTSDELGAVLGAAAVLGVLLFLCWL